MAEKDYYEILGVKKTATEAELKTSCRLRFGHTECEFRLDNGHAADAEHCSGSRIQSQ